jgi:hypothetical protein
MQFNSATPSELCLPLLRIPILAGGDARGGIAAAIGRAVALVDGRPEERDRRDRPAIALFCPEQNFAGTFSELVFDSVHADLVESELLLMRTRGLVAAAKCGLLSLRSIRCRRIHLALRSLRMPSRKPCTIVC